MNALNVCALTFADDLVLMAENEEDLQKIVSCVYERFEENGLKMNVKKTKVMVFEREVERTDCVVKVNNDCLEQVDEYVYLGSLFTRDGRCDGEIERRKLAGDRINGVLRPVIANKNISMVAKSTVHQAIVVPTIMYGSETWTWLKKDESGINAVEMRSLRRMCGKRIIDRVRNKQIRKECNVK